MARVLESGEIEAAIANSDWQLIDGSIVLDGQAADFASAWEFASRVAEAAEAADHHPDILVHGWNRWRISLCTHSAGGITDLDLGLASTIDRIQR